MNSKTRDFAYTLSANMLNFIMGFVTGFLIPKYLNIEDYGYLKIFSFYTTYVGFAHFGFLDGILIKYGSYNYEDLPRKKFRAYFKFFMLFQSLEAVVLVIVAGISIADPTRRLIMMLVAVNLVILNATTFFSFVHQITKRFKLFSINIVLSKLLYVIGSVALIAMQILNYLPYILFQTLVSIVILGIYIYANKPLILGKSEKLTEQKSDLKENFRIGFFVMVGNFMGLIILGMDRLYVDWFFDLKAFAMYSFAYTLISLFYVLLNSFTTVIYPYLTRAENSKLGGIYSIIKDSITLVMGFSMVGYFVLKLFILRFLPQYKDSLNILLVLMPTVLLNAQISILIANYYKTLKLTKEYTLNNIIAFIIGVVTNTAAILLYKNVVSIAIACILTFILWVLYSDYFFTKTLNIKLGKSRILEFYVLAIYFTAAVFFNAYIGTLFYIAAFVVFVAVGYRKDMKALIGIVKEKG